MRRVRYIFLLLALLSLVDIMPASAQQQSQYALYNYRNDGDFNAWLNIDVDSITYSNIGLDGIEYNNIVTQEVWTPDSCYRIPLEVIDSISFNAPKPEYQDNVFHITSYHLPYITAVDSLTITFDSSLPYLKRPAVGQVVTSDTFEEPLTDGFAGKVLDISDDGEHVIVICEGANITDVFKKLILVGKATAIDEEEAKRRPLLGPRKLLSDYEENGNVEFEFPGKVSVKINDFISIEDAVSMAADYYVYVDFPRFKMRATATGTHNLKTSWSIDSDKILEWMGYQTDKFEPDWATPVWPVVNIPGVFNFGIRAGAFLAPSVKLSLTGSTPLTFTHTFGFEISNTNTSVYLPLVYPIVNAHSELGTPEISLSLEGKLFAGIALGLKATVIGDKVLSADITGRFGPEFDAKIEMKQVLGEDDPLSWYSLLKDSKVGIQLKADAKVKAKVFGENRTDNLSWDWKWPIPGWEETRYLFPDFTQPELPHYLMPDPLDMHTTPHRDIIMPIYAGLGVYDENGNQIRAYYSGEKYRTDAYYQRIPHVYIGDLPTGQKYTCRPVFNIPSLPAIGEIKALPITTFTVPQPLSLEENAMSLPKNRGGKVYYEGGWGDYSVFVLDKSVCSAELKNDGVGRYIQVVGLKKGSTTITLKDLRTKEDKPILVTVTEEQPLVDLVLSTNNLSLHEGGTASVEITSGNGIYSVASSNENILKATLCNNTIAVEALNEGNAVISVSDELSGQKCFIAVEVLRYADLFISANDFTLQEGGTATVKITSGCGTYTLTNTAENVVTATLNGSTITLKALKAGNALVTVEDYTSGQTCSIAVTVTAKPDNPVTPGDAIDLGLPSGTLWASCNVGASSPEEYGLYFAWGETQGYTGDTSDGRSFYWASYKWMNAGQSSWKQVNKYTFADGQTRACWYDSSGTFIGDGLTELLPEDDAATANWGSDWQMPSNEQFEELINSSYTTTEWTTLNGVYGRKITCKSNGNSIFLPAAGYRGNASLYSAGSYGYYWSRSLDTYYSYGARGLSFHSGDIRTCYYLRYGGQSVRPVRAQN